MYYILGDIPLRKVDEKGERMVTAYSPALSEAEIKRAMANNDIYITRDADGKITYHWNT
jgi:hypothetical protein